jgi:hypothetical protein
MELALSRNAILNKTFSEAGFDYVISMRKLARCMQAQHGRRVPSVIAYGL